MIKFYFNGSPNPTKVALMLHEAAVPYEGIPVDPRRGEQFNPEYLKINPNAKVPALADGDKIIFDSNAILLYLATKTGKFNVAPDDPRYGEYLSWLMFVATGIGPFLGQAAHFEHFSPEKVPYAQKRYNFEADRHLKVVEERLDRATLHAGRRVHDRRHEPVGLDAVVVVHHGQGNVVALPQRQAPS